MFFHLHVKQIFNILDLKSSCNQYGNEAFSPAAKSQFINIDLSREEKNVHRYRWWPSQQWSSADSYTTK